MEPNDNLSVGRFGFGEKAHQVEQSAVRVMDEGTLTTLVAYIDNRGNVDPNTGLPASGDLSFMGLTRFDSTLGRWAPRSQLRAEGVDLQSDPWLATNRDRTQVWYSFVAQAGGAPTEAGRVPDAIAVSTSTDAGSTWTPALTGGLAEDSREVSVVDLDFPVDKPSIAISHSDREDVYVAFVNAQDRDDTNLYFLHAPGDDEVRLKSFDVGRDLRNPIVRVFPMFPNVVFVAYQVFFENGGPTFGLRIARFPRDLSTLITISVPGDLLNADDEQVAVDSIIPNLETDGVNILECARAADCASGVCQSVEDPGPLPDDLVDRVCLCGALAGGATCGADERCVDGVCRTDEPLALRPNSTLMDYFIANDGWHYLVYEDEGDIFFTRNDPLLSGWSQTQRLGLGGTRREFQPTVTARDSNVAVVFYDQHNAFADTRVTAWRSTDRGDGWTFDVITRGEEDERLEFQFCPRGIPGRDPFVGDYIAAIPLVRTADSPTDAFFAAWTDSRQGCVRQRRRVATHLHTFGTVFE